MLHQNETDNMDEYYCQLEALNKCFQKKSLSLFNRKPGLGLRQNQIEASVLARSPQLTNFEPGQYQDSLNEKSKSPVQVGFKYP